MSYQDPFDPHDPYDYDAYVEEAESASGRRWGCWIPISLLLILSLLGTSIYSAFWFISQRDSGPQIVVRDVTATPDVDELAPDEGFAEPFQNQEFFSSSDLEITAVPVPTTPAAEQTNRITFITPDSDIASIDPRGNDFRLHTEDDGRFSYPAWSPDSARIAAVGITPRGSGIFVVDTAEEFADLESLYSSRRETPFYLYWSPDSRQVTFLANHPDGIALHVVPADAATDNRLLSTGGPLYWQWSMDSKQLLMHNGEGPGDGSVEFFPVESEASGESLAPPGFFQSPGISSDGRFWAYAMQTGGRASSLVVIDVESDSRQQFAHRGQIAMSWSPVGNLLAFISPEEIGQFNYFGPLRVLDPQTGDMEIFSRETVYAFFWSPDGRYVATISDASSRDGFDINAADPEKNQTSKQEAQTRQLQLKLTVHDVISGEGRVLLQFQPTRLFVTQFLPFFDQYALSHRLWSPGSDALVLPVFEDGASQIVVVDVNSGQTRILAEGQMPSWSQR